MGDRYILELYCVYCGHTDKDVWYAPTCGANTFRCSECGKYNFVTPDFSSKKVEEVTDQEVIDGFFNATNVSWDNEEEVKVYRRGDAQRIRKLNEAKP